MPEKETGSYWKKQGRGQDGKGGASSQPWCGSGTLKSSVWARARQGSGNSQMTDSNHVTVASTGGGRAQHWQQCPVNTEDKHGLRSLSGHHIILTGHMLASFTSTYASLVIGEEGVSTEKMPS